MWRSEAKCGELTSRGLPAPGFLTVVLLHSAGDGLPVVGPVVDALPAPDAVPLPLLALHLHHVPGGGVERPAVAATNNLKDVELNYVLHCWHWISHYPETGHHDLFSGQSFVFVSKMFQTLISRKISSSGCFYPG